MDKSLEKSIYDHQVKKQQMSYRLIDKQNPEPYMSLYESSYSYHKTEDHSEITDFSIVYHSDISINNLLTNFPSLFTKEPLEHESFLIDRHENILSDTEAESAIADFKLSKQNIVEVSLDSEINAIHHSSGSSNSLKLHLFRQFFLNFFVNFVEGSVESEVDAGHPSSYSSKGNAQ